MTMMRTDTEIRVRLDKANGQPTVRVSQHAPDDVTQLLRADLEPDGELRTPILELDSPENYPEMDGICLLDQTGSALKWCVDCETYLETTDWDETEHLHGHESLIHAMDARDIIEVIPDE